MKTWQMIAGHSSGQPYGRSVNHLQFQHTKRKTCRAAAFCDIPPIRVNLA